MSMISSYPPSQGSGPRHLRPEDDSAPTFMPPYKAGTPEEDDELDALRQIEQRQKDPAWNTVNLPGRHTMEYRVPPSELGTSLVPDVIRNGRPGEFPRLPKPQPMPVIERQEPPDRNTVNLPGRHTMEYRVPPNEPGTSLLDDMLRSKHPAGLTRLPEATPMPASQEQVEQFREQLESAGKFKPTTDERPSMLAPWHGKIPGLHSPRPWSGDFGFMPPYKAGTPEEEEELEALREFEERPKTPHRRSIHQPEYRTMEYREPPAENDASSMPAPGSGELPSLRNPQARSGDFDLMPPYKAGTPEEDRVLEALRQFEEMRKAPGYRTKEYRERSPENGPAPGNGELPDFGSMLPESEYLKLMKLSQVNKETDPEQTSAPPPEAGAGPQMKEGAAGNGSSPHGTSEPPQLNYTPPKPTPEAPSGTMQAASQLPTGGGPASESSVGAAKSTEAGLISLQKLVFRELYDKDTPWEEKEKIRKFILSLTPQRGVKDLPQAVKNMQFWFDVDKRAKLPPEKQDLMELPPEFIEKSMAYRMGREKLLNHFRNTAGKKIFPNQTIMEWVKAQANGLTPAGTVPFDIPDTNFDTMTAFPMPFGPDADLYHSMGTFTMQGHGSNLKALQDKDGNIWIDGKIAVNVKDKYDWHRGLNVPITKQTIGQFIPGLYDVKFPPADAFTIEDSFFEEFLDKGLGKDFLMESSGFAPLQLRFSDKTKP